MMIFNMRSSWIICLALMSSVLVFPVYAETITIDGDRNDWVGITPLINDPSGDYLGYEDLIGVSVTNDQDNVYFLLDYENPVFKFGGRIGNYYLSLDTDLNPATGCNIYYPDDLGSEYMIVFMQGLGDYVGDVSDGRDCNVDLNDPNDVFKNVLTVDDLENNTFIEFSIPIETLRIVTPDTTGFRILTQNDHSSLAEYILELTKAAIVGSFTPLADLDGGIFYSEVWGARVMAQ